MFPLFCERQIKLDSRWINISHMFTHTNPSQHAYTGELIWIFFTPETTSETWLIFQTKRKDAAEKNKSYKNSNVGQGRPENSNTTTQVLQWGKSVVMCSWKTLEIPCDFFFLFYHGYIYSGFLGLAALGRWPQRESGHPTEQQMFKCSVQPPPRHPVPSQLFVH